jgi:hypothetical protein
MEVKNMEVKNIEDTKLVFYKVFIDLKRMGDIEGRFVCKKSDWFFFKEKYKNCSIHLDDYHGRYSEISICISKDLNVSIITDDQDFLNMAKNLKINLDCGFNPLDHLEELNRQLEGYGD